MTDSTRAAAPDTDLPGSDWWDEPAEAPVLAGLATPRPDSADRSQRTPPAPAAPWGARRAANTVAALSVADGPGDPGAGGPRRVNEAIAQLATARSPRDLVLRAPALLCEAGRFDRAMISTVSGSTWRPQALHVGAGADDPVNGRLAAVVTGMAVPLTGSLVETSALRRRAAMLVDGTAARQHTYAPLAALSRSRSYVVAPIVSVDRVVGFLHADCRASRRVLGAGDRALLSTFADLFGLLHERTVAAQRLRDQHQSVTAALAGVTDHRADITIAGLGRGDASVASPRAVASGSAATGGLTSREWEILGLMATGATNAQIAATLVVSEGTVKSHVKRILHKLPAANRAEAVYRYTRLAPAEGRAS